MAKKPKRRDPVVWLRLENGRYRLRFVDGKLQAHRAYGPFRWQANQGERETIARLLGHVLVDLWPQALRDEILDHLHHSY